MSKKVADILVETLEAAGVQNCYGIVGDTMNRIAHSIASSGIDFVHMRHEEAGAFAAGAEAVLTGRLTACAGSCGPGSLHFINGLYEAHRNRAPVVLIATQIVRSDIGFQSIQEVDFKEVFGGCSVFCDMILTAEQARRKTVAACQAALAKRGVAVLIVPADVANEPAADELPYAVHIANPVIRPSDEELDEIAAILNASNKITIYAGSGSEGAHDALVATAARLQAPTAHTSRGKDFVEYDNPYNVGMTGLIGGAAGYHAILDSEVLLLLGADFAWPQFYPNRARIIQVDIDPTHLGRRHPVEKAVVGSIKPTLEALLPRLEQHDDDAFLTKYVERHTSQREADAAESVSGPDAAIPRHLSRQADQPICRRRRLVRRRRRHASGPADAPCRYRWPASHLRQPASRHDGRRHGFGARAAEMPAGPAGDRDDRRRRLFDAARRHADDRAGKSADQDRRVR